MSPISPFVDGSFVPQDFFLCWACGMLQIHDGETCPCSGLPSSYTCCAFDVPKCSGQTQARSLLAVKARVGIRPISSVTCHNRQILKMVQKKQFEGEISSWNERSQVTQPDELIEMYMHHRMKLTWLRYISNSGRYSGLFELEMCKGHVFSWNAGKKAPSAIHWVNQKGRSSFGSSRYTYLLVTRVGWWEDKELRSTVKLGENVGSRENCEKGVVSDSPHLSRGIGDVANSM